MSILRRVSSHIQHVRAEREFQHNASRLASLSEHLLADIGATRSDMHRMDGAACKLRSGPWRNLILPRKDWDDPCHGIEHQAAR